MSANDSKNDSVLFDPHTRRLDAIQIAQDMNVPIDTVAGAIGVNTLVVRQHPDSNRLQAQLLPVYRVWAAIVELHAGNKKNARIFISAPNKHLENRAPIEFIERGDLKPLEGLAESMSAREPA